MAELDYIKRFSAEELTKMLVNVHQFYARNNAFVLKLRELAESPLEGISNKELIELVLGLSQISHQTVVELEDNIRDLIPNVLFAQGVLDQQSQLKG